MDNKLCEVNWDLVIKGAQVVATIVVAWLVYLFTGRNMRNETTERLSRYKNEKLYEAGMAFWSLLAYTTATENKHTILYWVKEKGGSEKKYYLHTANAKEFMEQLNTINYEKGYGLFLHSEVRELFYEYRGILYGFLLQTRNNTDEKILVENNEMATNMLQLHDKMVMVLRQEMKLENPRL